MSKSIERCLEIVLWFDSGIVSEIGFIKHFGSYKWVCYQAMHYKHGHQNVTKNNLK